MTKEEFWYWFDQNKKALEQFMLSNSRDYEIYNAFSAKLNEYNEYLIPELTMTKEKRFVLIISCDGMKEGIPFAEALTDNPGQYENWDIVTYRQPAPMELIPIGGIILKRKNIFLQWEQHPSGNYSLNFYVKGYSYADTNYCSAVILHMDHTIGEYNAMTRIEGIEIKRLGLFQSKRGLKTLDDLREELEK